MQDSSLITLIIFVITGLVALNALSYYSERIMLFPSVIWVLCLGMIYGALNHFKLLDLPGLYLDPHIILFALVPVLIFAAAKKMCLHHFRRVLKESTILATLGIVVSTFAGTHAFAGSFQGQISSSGARLTARGDSRCRVVPQTG